MPDTSPLVSTDWLADHLEDPQVAIADCRFALGDPSLGQQHYETGHIPGAVYVDLDRDLSGPVGTHGGRHPLPDLDALAQTLGAAGIQSGQAGEATLVVVYDDSRLAFASRLWWLLRYLGHDRVRVLDGGLSAWTAAGYELSTAMPQPTPAQFVPQVQTNWLVTRDDVLAALNQPGAVLVDSRESDRYRGEREPIDPIAGHIPGAVNYPWQEVTDAQGQVRSPSEQRQRWQAIAHHDQHLVYCGSGVTACVNLLSLEIAGLRSGKLYAGSWSDWCSYADAPDFAVATTASP
ncbi:sulfurtransferase [Leptolyngbya sp. CCY15150]|uniref:sulfurtransferase n=1 Tax=Leptolyngbya sp. CCY15150 TaxID=2767772 RepID=UPI00194F2BC6|nr:sulfurtransferase [Leptolyngbya sp. CCY15150]